MRALGSPAGLDDAVHSVAPLPIFRQIKRIGAECAKLVTSRMDGGSMALAVGKNDLWDPTQAMTSRPHRERELSEPWPQAQAGSML